MKTITIPGYKNPFVVVINNTVYQYKGGETIEVPDDVAEAIEDAIELIPKPKRYLSKLAQRADGSITEITINDLEGVETIVDSAFRFCYSAKKIEIPDSVKRIMAYAFQTCNSATSLRFGESSKIESIGIGAFNWCSVLARVYLPPKPPTLENVNAFGDINKNCIFYCKSQASLDAYKAAPNWSTLTGTYSFVVEE